MLKLASGSVGGVRSLAEAGAVVNLQLRVVEAGVARYYGPLGVIEADRRDIFEGVVNELGAVGFLDLDALEAADDGVLLEDVVLGPPGLHRVGKVGSKVRVGVVPGREGNSQRAVVREQNTVSCVRPLAW